MVTLELGVEPPIRLGDERVDRSERRRASLRWLAGAALTGLSGVALIGAALYFDLDSQYNFAEAPELATAPVSSESQDEGVSPGKGDRLLRPVDIVSDKQTYTVPTTIKVGDKELVKARAFTRLQTTLTMTPTGFADAVPPFNPLKLTNRADAPDTAPDPGPVQDDAEVTFRVRDLVPADAEHVSGELSLAEAQAQVVETLKTPPDAPKTPAQPRSPVPLDADEPGRGTRRRARLCDCGQRQSKRAFCFDRSAHDPGKRDERAEGRPGRRLPQ